MEVFLLSVSTFASDNSWKRAWVFLCAFCYVIDSDWLLLSARALHVIFELNQNFRAILDVNIHASLF